MTDLSNAVEIVDGGEPEAIEIVDDAPQAAAAPEGDEIEVEVPAEAQDFHGVPEEHIDDPGAAAEGEADPATVAEHAEQEGFADDFQAFTEQMEAAGIAAGQAIADWQDAVVELSGAADDVGSLLAAEAGPDVTGAFLGSLARFGAALRSGDTYEAPEFSDEVMDGLAALMKQPGNAAHVLAREWPASADLVENFRYAILAMSESVGVVDEDVIRFVDELGPEAAAKGIKAAAVMGRRLVFGPLNLERREKARQGGTMTKKMTKAEANKAIDRLTKEAWQATENGDRATADEKFAERDRIASALWPGPNIGGPDLSMPES